MKFNFKKYILALGMASVLLPSCNDDFMERYPQDQITDESFWKTETRPEAYAEQPLSSLYYRSRKRLVRRQDSGIERCRQSADVR